MTRDELLQLRSDLHARIREDAMSNRPTDSITNRSLVLVDEALTSAEGRPVDADHAVYDAWNNPGPAPDVHRRAQQWLRQHWPVLAQALDRLGSAR